MYLLFQSITANYNVKQQMSRIACEIWGSHGSEYVDVVILGCDAVWTRR
jgi:hypothetical protein